MIRVTRSAGNPKISVYTDKIHTGADGKTKLTRYEHERDRAIVFFTDPANYLAEKKLCKGKFAFLAYKNSALLERLVADFKGKCAYCESDFRAVTPSDVEHYRPKAAIKTPSSKLAPGYFWLAGDYGNLLNSCPDCNRPRKHKVPGQKKGTLLGKGSQFPLSDETLRVRSHKMAITAENGVRLLLDPCHDNPEDHLQFEASGNVRARKRNGVESAMGVHSIDVYALRRMNLVQKRRQAILDLAGVFHDLNHHVETDSLLRAQAASQVLLDRNMESIQGCMLKLISLFAKTSEYLGAKRNWIRDEDARGQFVALRAFDIEPLDLIGI